MQSPKTCPQSIDAYISQFDPDIQERLRSLRRVINEAGPEMQEKMSYQMPAFYLYGYVVFFAAFKNHIGFFPTPSGINAFKEELSGYKSAKGSVQFPLNKPLPFDLISRIVRYRIEENKKRAELKQKNK